VRRPRRATPGTPSSVLLLLSLSLPGAAFGAGQTAFVDGGSIAVAPSGITTLATLSPTFSAGNNFVIAVVEFETSVDTNLTSGTVWLKKVGSGASLGTNFYDIRLSTGIMAKRKWMPDGISTAAGSSPSYAVQVSYCRSVGVTGKRRYWLLLESQEARSLNPLDVDINATETTLTTLSTSLPAGRHIVPHRRDRQHWQYPA
jgi:hypothetical protein